MRKSECTFLINRYHPENASTTVQEYKLQLTEGMSILDCLLEIRDNQDSTLGFRASCRSGICGSCAMMVNGKNVLACETQVMLLKGKKIVIEPLKGFEVLKDLIVDLEPLYRSLFRLNAYFQGKKNCESEREFPQSVEDRGKLDGLYECILCGSCTGACPSFWTNNNFAGPAVLMRVHRYNLDSRDSASGERLNLVNSQNGIWRCHSILNCIEACPKGLNPAKALHLLKVSCLKAINT